MLDKDHVENVTKLFDKKKELFIAKNKDYSCSYLKAGTILDFIMDGEHVHLKTAEDHTAYQLLIRKLDKIIRYTTLRFGEGSDSVGEKLAETMGDDGVYGLMLSEFEDSCAKEVVKVEIGRAHV